MSAFQDVLQNDICGFGLWMNDPLSLLWSQRWDGTRTFHLRSIDTLPSWCWAAIDQPILWRYGGHDPIDCAPDRVFAKILKCPTSFTSGSVTLGGPLMTVDPAQLNLQDRTGISFSRRNSDTANDALLLSEFDAWYLLSNINIQYLGNVDLTFAPVYFMPMLRVNTKAPKMPYGAWGLLLIRASGNEVPAFRRVGTATLESATEQWDSIFAEHGMVSSDEDDPNRDDGGTYIVKII